jgi:hypothetical protein
MPDRRQSIPAPIPRIDSALWEKGEGFRETLLLQFTEPQANATLRDLGTLLFDLTLECSGSWPRRPRERTMPNSGPGRVEEIPSSRPPGEAGGDDRGLKATERTVSATLPPQ